MSDPTTLANAIRDAWRGSTASILEACARAYEAREDGCLMAVSGLLSGTVDRTTLVKLARIGEVSWPAYATDVLPPHWGTIYEIAKLDNAERTQRLVDGSITPSVMRSTVTGWRRVVALVPVPSSGGPMVAPLGWDGVERRAAPAAPVLSDVESIVSCAETLRKAGKPADHAGKVKAARLQMAISFLQAVLAADTSNAKAP